jgi:hypothetical protein
MCSGWVVNATDGTAFDQSTNLAWQVGSAPGYGLGGLDWQDAQTYCNGLSW